MKELKLFLAIPILFSLSVFSQEKFKVVKENKHTLANYNVYWCLTEFSDTIMVIIKRDCESQIVTEDELIEVRSIYDGNAIRLGHITWVIHKENFEDVVFPKYRKVYEIECK